MKLGKHDGLKIHCLKGLAGSNPASGTMKVKNILASIILSGSILLAGNSADAKPLTPNIPKVAACNSKNFNGVMLGKIYTLQWVPVTWWFCYPATINTKHYTITDVESRGFQLWLYYSDGVAICLNHGAVIARYYQHPSSVKFTFNLTRCGAKLIM